MAIDWVVKLLTSTRAPLCDVVRESASVYRVAVALTLPATLTSVDADAKFSASLGNRSSAVDSVPLSLNVRAITLPPVTATAPPETEDMVPSATELISARTFRLLAAEDVPFPTSP